MPDGGELTMSTARRELERLGFLRVRDTGIGMDEATKARIFEPLFTTKPEGRGTGFGLATASSVVAQLGGRIDVETAPGEGTTFTILLPEAEAPKADPLEGSDPAPKRRRKGRARV
jgi:signal transduction histidine kinase